MSVPEECCKDAPVLSSRGANTASHSDFLDDYFYISNANPYHPDNNPDGVVNLGTAVNRLTEEELLERLSRGDTLSYSTFFQHYYDFDGTQELKDALLEFLQRHFHPLEPILKEEIVVMNGVTSCLDALSHTLCDPGDVIITPSPTYSCIFSDVHSRAGAEVLDMREEDDFALHPEALEALIASLRSRGRRVRAFLLVHPNNPLGDIYSVDLLKSLLNVCARQEIHFISDEIYALCIFPSEVEDVSHPRFPSVLSLPHPDPERTHVLWGMSKDFGLAGFRIGVVISRCAQAMSCLRQLVNYACTPHIIQHAAAKMLSDAAWCDDLYVRVNSARLQRAYGFASKRLKAMGIRVREARAALFLWVSVRDFMGAYTPEEEMELFKEMIEAGVYVVPGSKMYSVDPGWIRIVFSVSEKELDEGLKRIESVLKKRKCLK